MREAQERKVVLRGIAPVAVEMGDLAQFLSQVGAQIETQRASAGAFGKDGSCVWMSAVVRLVSCSSWTLNNGPYHYNFGNRRRRISPSLGR